ncbi:MAG: hypothetical protein B7Y90_06120 [Alphaproteobacteria bacterium 32-64-14]|nr:MAG: hypothetical protein B7Y90_06120 [Alphaproteobacteria bacterium 32-64-14]
MMKSIAAGMMALPLMAGCATAPQPCTSEWVDWKTQRIIGQFVAGHGKQIGELRDIAPIMFGPAGGLQDIAPNAMMVLTAIGALDLVLEFANDAWPQITDAVAECAADPNAAYLFANMLRDQGVDERAVAAIERLGNIVDFER